MTIKYYRKKGTKEAIHATEFKSAPEIKRKWFNIFDPVRVEKAMEELRSEFKNTSHLTKQYYQSLFPQGKNIVDLKIKSQNLLDALEETKKTGSDCNKVNIFDEWMKYYALPTSSQKINDFEEEKNQHKSIWKDPKGK